MTGHDRDRQIDRHLRRAFEGRPAAASADCLDAESLAAWVDGGLDHVEAARAETHVSSCARCQAMAGVLAQATPVEAPAAWWKGWMGWLVPLTATAAAVGVWLVVPNPTQTARPAAPQVSLDEAPVPPAPAGSARGAAPEPRPPGSAAPRNLRAQAPAARARKDQAPEPQAEAKQSAAVPVAPAAEMQTSPARPAVANPALAQGRAIGREADPWRQRAAAQGIEPTAIASPSPAVCWVVGRAGAVWLSIDGRTFRRLPFPESIDLVSVEAADPVAATVTGANGHVFRTADGGMTWRR